MRPILAAPFLPPGPHALPIFVFRKANAHIQPSWPPHHRFTFYMVVDTGKPGSLTALFLAVPPLDIFTISSHVFSRTPSHMFCSPDVRAGGDRSVFSRILRIRIREHTWVYFASERFSLVYSRTKEKRDKSNIIRLNILCVVSLVSSLQTSYRTEHLAQVYRVSCLLSNTNPAGMNLCIKKADIFFCGCVI